MIFCIHVTDQWFHITCNLSKAANSVIEFACATPQKRTHAHVKEIARGEGTPARPSSPCVALGPLLPLNGSIYRKQYEAAGATTHGNVR